MSTFPKMSEYSFERCFCPWEASHCRVFCVSAHIRASRNREHPSDDPFHPSIKLNKSADQRVSSRSLPPKATVSMAATRLLLRRQREKHTNKTTHSKWRLELFHLSEEECDLSMAGQRSWQVELNGHDSMRSGTACVSEFYTTADMLHIQYVLPSNLAISGSWPSVWRGTLIVAAQKWWQAQIYLVWQLHAIPISHNCLYKSLKCNWSTECTCLPVNVIENCRVTYFGAFR